MVSLGYLNLFFAIIKDNNAFLLFLFQVFFVKTAQLFALFIIGFMGFSTVAFVLSASFSENPAAATDNSAGTPGAQLSFSARVDANVLEIFPSFKMIAETKEFDIAKIDSALLQIDGVSQVNSMFNDSGQGTVNYFADISFDAKKTSFQKLTSEINEKTLSFFNQTGFFPNALIEVPKKFVLENSDLNISKEFEPKDALFSAQIMPDTIKGDKIVAYLEIVFSGEQPLSLSACYDKPICRFEVSNYSSQTGQHEALLSFPLASLEPKLSFSADADYSNKLDENSLKESILSIQDINSVELSFEPVYNAMLLTINNPADSNALLQDLNNAIPTIKNVSSVEFVPGTSDLNAIISFSENANITQLKDDVSQALSGLKIEKQNYFFTESTVTVSASIGLKTIEAKPIAEALKALLLSKKFSAKIYQPGTLKAEALTDLQTNERFSVDSNSIDALLFAGHAIGDEIFASIMFSSQRGKLVNAIAREEINPIRTS